MEKESNGDLKCPVCQVVSYSRCSNCLKVVYCGKDHQKQHYRKVHKKECFPATIKSHPTLGEHLAATRDIKEGEVIFKEKPLIFGPRSNLSKFEKICLGCCNPVKGSFVCSKCKWPLCEKQCETSSWHSTFDCPILTKNHVPPASTQDEYLHITFLRGVLLKYLDAEKWAQLKAFESHANSRNTVSLTLKQSEDAYKFIAKTCGLTDVDKNTVDFVYGIILVNGYGDTSTYAVKLYSKAGKLSHACIPNTRTRVIPSGLEVIAAVDLKAGQPLTQLYGRMLKGTHKRQELLQNVYYFSCTCIRCKDPTENSTYFSAIKCPQKKCSGNLLPKNPMKLDGNSKWECDNKKCGLTTTYLKSVIPTLEKVSKDLEMDEDTPLFTQYQTYIGENVVEDEETVALAQLQLILGIEEKLKHAVTLTHSNHYILLPIKTACIATCHTLLQNLAKFDEKMFAKVIQIYNRLTHEVYDIINVFLPGCTSERGILLFHLAEGLRLAEQSQGNIYCPEEESGLGLNEKLRKLQNDCTKIMDLEPDGDPYKEMALPYLERFRKS